MPHWHHSNRPTRSTQLCLVLGSPPKGAESRFGEKRLLINPISTSQQSQRVYVLCSRLAVSSRLAVRNVQRRRRALARMLPPAGAASAQCPCLRDYRWRPRLTAFREGGLGFPACLACCCCCCCFVFTSVCVLWGRSIFSRLAFFFCQGETSVATGTPSRGKPEGL